MSGERLAELTSWDAPWRDLRVVVTGISVTGFSVADTLIELGARVVVVDSLDNEHTRDRADTLRIVGAAQVLLGEQYTRSVPLVEGHKPDLIVTSPGWPPHQPLLRQAEEQGILIWGEVELAWRLNERAGKNAPAWLVLTGTNGKTTTTALAESMLLAAGVRAIAVGNIGTPILDALRHPQEFDVFVVELSSFQLHYTYTMAPLASAVLNIAEDHLDWYGGDFSAYVADKAKIYHNTEVACIYNAQEPATLTMVQDAEVQEGARAVGFTTGVPEISMLGVVEDYLVDRAFIPERRTAAAELGTLSDLGPNPPRHLVANALAAAALVRAYGVEPQAVQEGLIHRPSSEHRIESLGQIEGVDWVNDSKATNPHAAAAALGAFENLVWIVGGLSKGLAYDELILSHAHRLNAAVLIGADSSSLHEAFKRHAPDVPVIVIPARETEDGQDPLLERERVVREAVQTAARVARPGDTVLLAPAAASQDQFSSYAERGALFKQAVAALKSSEHPGKDENRESRTDQPE